MDDDQQQRTMVVRHYLHGGGIGIDWYLPDTETAVARVDVFWRGPEHAFDRVYVSYGNAFREPPADVARTIALIGEAVAFARRVERGEIAPDDVARQLEPQD